jgi:hypothetical protein
MLLYRTLYLLGLSLANICVCKRRYGGMHTEGNMLAFPGWALLHKTTYAPMIYTSLCVMFLRRADAFRGQVGGGWTLEISNFLGPKWHSPIGLMPFHHFTGPKKLNSSKNYLSPSPAIYMRSNNYLPPSPATLEVITTCTLPTSTFNAFSLVVPKKGNVFLCT